MKRILSLILVLLLSLTVMVGCDKVPALKEVGDKVNDLVDKIPTFEEIGDKVTDLVGKIPVIGDLINKDEPKEDPKPVTYDVNAAVEYVRTLYIKGDSTTETGAVITASDYEVVGQVMVAGVKYVVEWSVDNDKVKLVKGETSWTVDVDNKAPEAHDYKLTATVVAGDGTKGAVTFDRHVPEYKVISFEEYMAAKEGDTVTVEGIVVAINSKAANNKYNHLFLADASGKGGYYVYSLSKDPVKDYGIKVGMTVSVTSTVKPYSGMQELSGGSATIIDETIKTVDVKDITDAVKNGDETTLKNYVGLPVTIKGVTIGTQELEKDTSQYLNFTVGEKTAYVRTYVTDFPTTFTLTKDEKGNVSCADKQTIDEAHAAKFGWTANATGILVLYNSKPYLIPMGTDCFEYLEFVEKTPAEKITAEANNLSVPTAVTENTTIALPLVGKYYNEVTITWAINNEAYTIGEDGKLAIVLGEEKVELTLTATVACEGAQSVTKEFTVKVDAAATDIYVPESVTDVKADTAYKFFLVQANLGKTLYITGEVDGRYLVTTDKADQAVDVYVEAAENGFKFYILVEDAKQYITVYNNAENKLSVKFDAQGTSVYAYNATVNAWVTNLDGTDYYLGTYNNFNTVSASKLSFITAENTGVSQFPAGFATLAPAIIVPESVTDVKAETAYKFFLVQANLGKTLYITGEVDGRYLVTTDKADQAVDVYVEAAENGFKFYILVEDAKQYITVYNNAENKLSVKFDAQGTSVYAYNATVNAWVTNLDGTDYYLGTYNNFNTVSASKLSFITAENTGVSQFPAGFAIIAVVEENNEGETPVDPTPDQPGEGGGETPVDPTPGEGEDPVVPEYTPMTVEQALAAALDTKVQITGTVSRMYQDWSTQFNNCSPYITDETGKEIIIFRTTVSVKVGDVVTVTGVIGQFNNINQIAQGNTLTVVTAHVCSDWNEATCTAPKTCKVCGATEGDVTDHNYVNGSCSVCGAAQPSEGKTTVSVKKTHTEVATIAGVTVGQNTGVITGKNIALNDDITVVCAKGNSTSDPCIYSESIRMYQGGATITIKAAEGCEMATITITLATKSGGQGPITVTGGTASALANYTYTITVEAGVSEVVITTAGTDKNNRLYVAAIEVTYAK